MTAATAVLARDAQARSRALGSVARDVSLGVVAGLDLVLWNYSMASLIFAGALAGHLRLGAGVVFAGAALVMVVTALNSSYDLHVLVVDEQAVAVLATIAAALSVRLPELASADAAAATMFAIMASVTLAVGACLQLSARFNGAQLLQLVPFPVVCGFLGGLGWLLFGAGVTMLTGHAPGLAAVPSLLSAPSLAQLLPALAGGAAIFVALRRSRHFLLLPGLLLGYVVAFYLVASFLGASAADLRGVWLFEADASSGRTFRDLDFRNVDFGFVASVAPEMATIVVLGVLGASINLSGLEVASRKTLPMSRELRSLGSANIASGLVMGLPAVTEIVASTTYGRVGARSRLFVAVIAAICAAAVFGGAHLIAYLPKVVMGALVFFAAIQFMSDWLITASRRLTRPDAAVVWLIFGTIGAVGFMPGIVVGIGLASLLFVVRYAKVGIVGSSFLLSERGSSVDRPAHEMRVLGDSGAGVRVFNLRGFLFFGTASAFFDQLREQCEQGAGAGYTHLIFNFQNVTGIDSTVEQTFTRIGVYLESRGISAVYCGMHSAVAQAFGRVASDAPREECDTLDAALKWTEERILAARIPARVERPIQVILRDALGCAEKAAHLAGVMQRVPLEAGEYLFRQGDTDTSLYVIERGAIEVRLDDGNGPPTVLREFREGTVIGEMASYSGCRQRSASAVALTGTVVHRFGPDMLTALGAEAPTYQAILHEFTARVLVSRLQFMNKRFALGV